MPKLHILVDEKGDVLGTLRAEEAGGGLGAPSAGFRARPGQRLVEVHVDESVAGLEPAELHKRLKAQHLK
jgi:hypothetical protein